MLRLRYNRGKEGSNSTINMTPMIDVVFQLLIFFLLTSILVAQPVLELVLPEAEHTKGKEERNEIHLFIQKGGKVFLGEEEVSMEDLSEALRNKMGNAVKKGFILSVDQDVPFRIFVRVMDIAKGLGISDMAIVTRRPKEK